MDNRSFLRLFERPERPRNVPPATHVYAPMPPVQPPRPSPVPSPAPPDRRPSPTPLRIPLPTRLTADQAFLRLFERHPRRAPTEPVEDRKPEAAVIPPPAPEMPIRRAPLRPVPRPPAPAPTPSAADLGYPFAANDILPAAALNAALEGNPGLGLIGNSFKLWFDTSTQEVRQRWWDGAQWVTAAALDPGAHLWLPLFGGGTTTLASAAIVDLGSVFETRVTITGSVPISSFGTSWPRGSGKLLSFRDGATLTASASMVILGGSGGNLVTAPGDGAFAWALGSGNWEVFFLPAISASGLLDAPADGRSYGRRNAAWNPVLALSNDILDGGNF